MPISPANTRSCSTRSSNVIALEVRPSAASGRRRPSVRSASPASSSLVCRISARRSAVRGRRLLADELLRAARQQHVRRAFGEDEQALLPLGVAYESCSSTCARRRTAPRRRAAKRASSASASSPALRAATISAPSVGSPCTVQRPSRSCSTALFARSATASARSSSNRSAPSIGPPSVAAHVAFGRVARAARRSTRPLAVTTTRTVISFFVSVPVLSEAMTFAEPSVSTAARCRTMAFRFAMRCTPSDEHGGHHRRQAFRHRRDRERHAEDEHVEDRREAAHVLDEDDRRDHHDGDDDDDDRRAACRRDRAPSAAAWSRPASPSAARRCAPSRSACPSP